MPKTKEIHETFRGFLFPHHVACCRKSYPRGTKLAEPVEIPTAEPPAHLKTPSNSMPPEGPVLGQGEGKSQKKKVVTKALPSLLSDDVAPRRDWELDYGRSSERNTPVDIPRNDADSEDRDERESKAVGVRQGQPKPSKDERVDRYDDAKYKRKYRELKHKISEVEEDNQRLEDEYLMAKKRLSRIKFERQLLLDRLQVVQAEAAGGEEHSGEFSDSNSSSGTSRSPPDSLQRHEEQQRGSKGPPKQRKKREKKIVDPNAPRRPANAFMFFCDQSRELLKKERGSMREAEIKSQGLTNLTKALGARWKALNSEERLDWKARYLTEVKRYHGEMAQYEQSEAPGSKKRKIGDVTTPAQSGASPAHSPHRQNHHPQETRSHDRYDEEIGAVPDDDYSGQEDDENDEEDRNDDADPNGMDVDDFSDGDSLDDDPSSVRLHPSAQSWKAGSPGPAFKNGHVYG
ncbi:hypothetical protein DFJ77DRAFT_464714 [Powellomyces hirtus]|nr:hypothetical protein DFJ77DRAFT_464714 [Powellomyces hirtus]